jgi:enoyl-CoA hydratase/carnithine racemase
MADELVRYSVSGRVARIVLDRPDAGNLFTTGMMRGLAGAFTAATASQAAVTLLCAAGPDFSRGRDRDETLPAGMTRLDSTALIVEVGEAVRAYPGLLVTAVSGRAMGFGCGLVVQSDLSVAADTAQFGFDEILHGSAPRFVMAYLEDAIGPKRALDLLVTGRALEAAEAERIGLVSRVVPAADLASSAEAMVSALLERDPVAIRTCKSYLREIRAIEPDERLKHALAATAAGRANRAAAAGP